ncbi:MAG: glycosyltransferase family 2 protein [Candidatus Omnitrophota bacterium]
MDEKFSSKPVVLPVYSIVLPVFNEEACLPDILRRLETILTPLGEPFEVICVDDGSKDSSWAIIEQTNRTKPFVKGVKFLRNFGHQLAVFAGIKLCRGQFIAIMDADGQDPPELLPKFFDKCKEGYDVVFAVRKNRKENAIKKFCYKTFYQFYKYIVPFDVPLDSGDFTVFTRHVAEFLKSLDEKKPFIRGLRSWYGGRQTGIEYERDTRMAGSPKYSFYKLILLAINGSISFSRAPLRAITFLGIFISFGSFLAGLYLLFRKMTVGIELLGWTSTIIIIIFFGGLNLFVLGVISEYIGDIFDEVKGRPQFLIKETIGLK